MKKILSFFVLIFSIFHFSVSVKSQVRPVYDYGAIGLGQLLKKLNTTKSVMMIGAHPDDEDSALLAYLARGENARTAYLSLTRGDGGQNIIGSELFESLGVIRTEELLQARRLDGAEQYFTRAFDYGFSKTLTEAKAKWDEKIVLCDAVKAIRQFRPLVVISRFSGTPADGHGQHQFSGYISPLAVKAAADETQCKDAGQTWQVQKFYVGQGFRSTQEPTLKINTGRYDPLIGRSYFEIAMEGRSQHKTQEQGVLELKGEKFSGLNLLESRVQKTEKEKSVFDGIDTSLAGMQKTYFKDEKSIDESTKEHLKIIQQSVERAIKEYEPNNPQKIISYLIDGEIEARKLFFNSISFSGTDDERKKWEEKNANESNIKSLSFLIRRDFVDAIKLASGIQIDALTDKETVVPGESFLTSVRVFFPNTENMKVKEISIITPDTFTKKGDWTVSKVEEPKDANQNPFRREAAKDAAFFDVKVPSNEHSTQPYFLENPRDGYLYKLGNVLNPILPFQSQTVSVSAIIEINGKDIYFNQPVEYRFADDIRGEVRRELNIVPAVSISLDQNLLIVPQSNKPQTIKVVMSVTNNSDKVIEGEASLNSGLNRGWKSVPLSQTFKLTKKNEKTAISFEFTIPPNSDEGQYKILPTVFLGDAMFVDEMVTLAYPHIQTHRFYRQVSATLNLLNLKTAPVKIGYIAGSGDRVFEAIKQMNFDAEILTENDLTNGDLSKFDTIVVGIRASQVRPDFIANHQRLLDYVKNGGTLLVQYQLPVYQSLLPFPAKMDARVTDENAKVTVLDPANPVFNFPNKITDKDFENWVQERNLYAFSTFDANYKPLLESHDENEAENKGGLVVAEIGKGKYIYCSYAFFRQLPAGVPGAYRLFANLLSLPKSGQQKTLRKK